jgi:hypothetical protein
MQNSSSVNTLAATVSMTGVCAAVQWVANSKLGLAMPPEVVLFTGAILTSASHFIVNFINAWIAVDEPKIAAAMTLPTTIESQP